MGLGCGIGCEESLITHLPTTGPAYAPQGIWRSIYLTAYSQPYPTDLTVVTSPVDMVLDH